MKDKRLLLSGLLAAIVYVTAVILGGLLRPGYDHLTQPISELTAAGVPNKGLLDIFFLVYNLFVIVFGVSLFLRANRDSRGRLSGRVAGVALVAAGICGVLLQLFFPQDPGGASAPVTTTGTLHIVFAGCAALVSMLTLLCGALMFRKQTELKGYVVYSLLSLVVMFVSGGFGAAAATSGFALFGLVERITIGTFVLWLYVISRALYRVATTTSSEGVTSGG
jgi:hypothetical protein